MIIMVSWVKHTLLPPPNNHLTHTQTISTNLDRPTYKLPLSSTAIEAQAWYNSLTASLQSKAKYHLLYIPSVFDKLIAIQTELSFNF